RDLDEDLERKRLVDDVERLGEAAHAARPEGLEGHAGARAVLRIVRALAHLGDDRLPGSGPRAGDAGEGVVPDRGVARREVLRDAVDLRPITRRGGVVFFGDLGGTAGDLIDRIAAEASEKTAARRGFQEGQEGAGRRADADLLTTVQEHLEEASHSDVL